MKGTGSPEPIYNLPEAVFFFAAEPRLTSALLFLIPNCVCAVRKPSLQILLGGTRSSRGRAGACITRRQPCFGSSIPYPAPKGLRHRGACSKGRSPEFCCSLETHSFIRGCDGARRRYSEPSRSLPGEEEEVKQQEKCGLWVTPHLPGELTAA